MEVMHGKIGWLGRGQSERWSAWGMMRWCATMGQTDMRRAALGDAKPMALFGSLTPQRCLSGGSPRSTAQSWRIDGCCRVLAEVLACS